MSDKMEEYTRIELQLGDVIRITNPLNEVLDGETFIIDYIDQSKTFLINTETFEKVRVPISEDGTFGDGNIKRISILSRSETPSYAIQNGLTTNKWINIYFGGDYPVIITGEITNLENDMIEIKTVDNDTIYINFDYKGIPENLPIEMIEIREKPSEPLEEKEEKEEEEEDEKEEDEQERQDKIPDILSEKEFIEPDKIQLNIPIKDIKEQIREFVIKADQVKFGKEEFGPIVQYVDVSSRNQRYSIETQVTDLLDELLSSIPNIERTPRVLNNIHIMIERFKQLRENFSLFDQYGNIEGVKKKEATFKPLFLYFQNLNKNLYWILPVVKNIKKIYNASHVDEENSDVINLDLDRDIKGIRDLYEKYKSNDLSNEQNKYFSLYSEMNQFLTPFETIDDENMNGIIVQKYTFTNLNTVVDNLEDMYSSIFSNNSVKERRFIIQKYNTALTKLDSSESKMVTVRTNITNNDLLSIKSFITLPEPIIRFSKINLPGTNILDKANLNLSFLNYWEMLKNKKIRLNTNFVDIDDETEFEFDEQNFANNIKNFVLNENDKLKGLTREEIYNNFVKKIIPKTKILFNLMKKYINGKLSIVNVVSYLEPFLIYTDDLTFMQYREIVEFIDIKISEYNKKFLERSRLFKVIGEFKRENTIFSKVFTVIDILDKKLREQVFEDGYDIITDKPSISNSEIIKKMLLKDNTKLYTAALSLQNFPLMFPSEFSTLFSDEKDKLGKKLEDEENAEKCKTFVISKYYSSIDELKNDDDKTIYFDKRYDKTNYNVLEDSNGYENQVLTMSPDELKNYIVKDLITKKRMTEKDAEYLADTLIDGHKKVIDGQYAIFYKGYSDNSSDEIEYYIRENNKWVLDQKLNKEKINTDDPNILCDIQKECINFTTANEEKCESTKENELGLQTKLLKNIMSEFDTKYKISKEELKENIDNQFKYFESIIPVINKIYTNELLKYNNQKYKLGVVTDDDQHMYQFSPYKPLLNLIMGQSDFIKKQTDIIKFTNMYTRESIEGYGELNEIEEGSWLYCTKTNVKLLPSFVFNLADKFVTEGQYEYVKYLEIVKSKIGTESDDGDWWVDKNSGWTICPIDFNIDEGYDAGFKISSRAIMEEDAGNKILSALSKPIKYNTPETKIINNIVNALSVAMGINLENQKEFIINCVLSSIRDTVESESDYKRKVREMAEKGKKTISYKDFFNTSLLYYTLGMFLIAVQTSVPSVKTRKTHPGCIRSFSGYPFEGAGDLSSLTYLGCVAYDIRESGEPWNVLKGKKKEIIINKIKGSIDEILLPIPDVKRKIEEKTDYLLTNTSNDIPDEHDITKWLQFLPPLINFSVRHLTNISSEFTKTLNSDLRIGSINQREKILVIQSKIIKFSLALVEKIQEIVKKQHLLLHTMGNEPYLENACCQTSENETTIGYFLKHDSNIFEYNKIVKQLSDLNEDINNYSKSALFFTNTNTKNKYPSIVAEFSEKTIYMAFIYFCKFKSLIPIREDLLSICNNKPEIGVINPNDSLDRIIQKLKEDGRNYTNEQFLRMLQIVSRNNTININVNTPEISYITKISKFLESLDEEEDEGIDSDLRSLISNLLDTYNVAEEGYTKEAKALNNFLIKDIEKMKEDIISFIQQNKSATVTNSSVKKTIKTIQKLSEWTSTTEEDANAKNNDHFYSIINFYKTFIENFANIFPNIILNNVKYDDVYIPNYYGFSLNHANKLKSYISKYYEKLKRFYSVPSLQNILIKIQSFSKNLIRMSKNTPSFSSIHLSEKKTIYPLFDEKTSTYLFEYYLLKIMINYIELSEEDDMIVPENTKKTPEISDIFAVDYLEEQDTMIDLSMTTTTDKDIRMLTGNKKELRQKISELFTVFFDILNNHKETIDTTYQDIQDRVFKLREKEKDMVTDRLKMMTDEERDADTILKINKLGMYVKGLQKGLTTLDKDFYDEEQEFRDKLEQAERKIRKKNADADDENIDMLLDDFIEQADADDIIDREDNDMSYMNETFFDGNTDGFSAPEEEYDDYQEDF